MFTCQYVSTWMGSNMAPAAARGVGKGFGLFFFLREKKVSLVPKHWSCWIIRTNARGVRLTIHLTWQTGFAQGERAFYLLYAFCNMYY